ncbi:MAG: ATP-binding cassette domain-containing protein [Pseudomonadota bacterium]
MVEDISPTARFSGAAIPAIRLRGIVNAFGDHVVHDGLDLDIDQGEIMGVIGPSGCGKSVLLRAIVGLRPPRGGSVEIFGDDLGRLSGEARQRVEQSWGVMFQDGALFSNLTVLENVMVPIKEHVPMSHQLVRELADMKLRMAGLETSAGEKFPSDLSGGMRKRAALARALALDPRLLFLDEPTAGLDPITAGRFDRLIRDLQQAMGLTVFLVTHDLDTLAATCDRITVLGEKKVLAVGTIDELRRDAHPWIQEYFSGPRGRAASAGYETEGS